MEKTYLDKIKEAEEKAAGIFRDAVNKSELMLGDAEKEHSEYERKSIEKIDEQCKNMLLKAEQEAADLVQKADREYAKMSEDLKTEALSNVKEAVDFVLEKVTNGSRQHEEDLHNRPFKGEKAHAFFPSEARRCGHSGYAD